MTSISNLPLRWTVLKVKMALPEEQVEMPNLMWFKLNLWLINQMLTILKGLNGAFTPMSVRNKFTIPLYNIFQKDSFIFLYFELVFHFLMFQVLSAATKYLNISVLGKVLCAGVTLVKLIDNFCLNFSVAEICNCVNLRV